MYSLYHINDIYFGNSLCRESLNKVWRSWWVQLEFVTVTYTLIRGREAANNMSLALDHLQWIASGRRIGVTHILINSGPSRWFPVGGSYTFHGRDHAEFRQPPPIHCQRSHPTHQLVCGPPSRQGEKLSSRRMLKRFGLTVASDWAPQTGGGKPYPWICAQGTFNRESSPSTIAGEEQTSWPALRRRSVKGKGWNQILKKAKMMNTRKVEKRKGVVRVKPANSLASLEV